MENLIPDKPKCGACGRTGAKRCSRCQGEWYCNRYNNTWLFYHKMIQRSSLYTENASCVGPMKHQGPLALKDVLILDSFLSLASGHENMNDHLFECSALSHSLHKNKWKHVTWFSYSLLLETKKVESVSSHGRDTVSRVRIGTDFNKLLCYTKFLIYKLDKEKGNIQ